LVKNDIDPHGWALKRESRMVEDGPGKDIHGRRRSPKYHNTKGVGKRTDKEYRNKKKGREKTTSVKKEREKRGAEGKG